MISPLIKKCVGMKSLAVEMTLKTEHWLETSSWLLQGHPQHRGQANGDSFIRFLIKSKNLIRKVPEVRSNFVLQWTKKQIAVIGQLS